MTENGGMSNVDRIWSGAHNKHLMSERGVKTSKNVKTAEPFGASFGLPLLQRRF